MQSKKMMNFFIECMGIGVATGVALVIQSIIETKMNEYANAQADRGNDEWDDVLQKPADAKGKIDKVGKVREYTNLYSTPWDKTKANHLGHLKDLMKHSSNKGKSFEKADSIICAKESKDEWIDDDMNLSELEFDSSSDIEE